MRIIELLIDKIEELTGFDAVALVEEPAIEADFMAFNNKKILDTIEFEVLKLAMKEHFESIVVEGKPLFDTIEEAERVAKLLGCEGHHEHEVEGKIWYMPCKEHSDLTDDLLENYEFESFDDYPESGQVAAQRAIDYKEANPDTDCGTRVGWTRARQLANGQPISEDTIARIASFKRHQQHKDVPYSEGCGGLMWDAWGGTAMIEWASNKLERIRASKQSLKKSNVMLTKENLELIEKQSNFSSTKFFKFGINEDQMKVIGAMLIPDKLIMRIDEEGNSYYVYFSKETVKAIAEKAMKNKLIDIVNLEHNPDHKVDAYMTKSWLVEDTDNDLSNKYGMNLPEGTWVAEYKIEDLEVWNDIKNGVYKGFSIEGVFQNNIVNAA